MAASPDDTHEQTRIPDSDRTAMPSSAPSAPAPAGGESGLALPVGTRLHEFEITGVIGEGGFGIVYAAQDHSLDRAVALKEYMPGALATRTQGTTVSVRSDRHRETFELGLKSFVNEARLLARFDHPSLVKVYRFWEAHGTAYMAMPHYHGQTLKTRLKAMGEPPDEAWLRRLLASVLEALEVIHEANVFHRDIAPDNIMLLEDDVPVLLDFGAARRVIGDATQGLTVILKPGYAPIEQYAEVKSMKQGAWTDVYALAATMYSAITGRPPEPAVARMMNDTLVPMVETGCGRYSEGFLSAMDAALRVKPEERPQNVAALRVLLDAAQPAQARPQPARAGAQPQRGAPQAKKSSRVPLYAGGATLAAALAAGGYLYLNPGTGPEVATATPAAPAKPAAQPEPSPPAPPSPPTTVAEPPVATVAPAPPPVPATPAPVSEPAPLATAKEPAAPPAPKPPAVVAKPPVPVPPAVAVAPTVPVPARKEPAYGAPAAPQGLDQETYRQPAPARDTVEPPAQLRALVTQAQQSLARREFRRAMGLADNALALDPNNLQARDIRRRAQEGEKRAFEEIKIE